MHGEMVRDLEVRWSGVCIRLLGGVDRKVGEMGGMAGGWVGGLEEEADDEFKQWSWPKLSRQEAVVLKRGLVW